MTRPNDDRPDASPHPEGKSNSEPNGQPSGQSSGEFDREFDREFERLNLELAALDARKRQIDRDRQTRDRLRSQLKHAQGQPDGAPSAPNASSALSELRDRLELLDLNLESSLFSWTSFREPFWFGLRYGGLGFVLGWLLHACTQ